MGKGIAFIEYKNQEGVDKATAFNEQEYAGRTIYVSKAGEGPRGKDGDKGKGKGEKGSKGNNDLTVFVRGLAWSLTEEIMRKDFGECGEVVSLRMPMNEEGKPKGIAF